jgi:hypothetical protein
MQGDLQHIAGTDGAYVQSLDGMFVIVLWTGRGCHVEHLVDGPIDFVRLGNILLNKSKSGITVEMRNIAQTSGEEIVQSNNYMALLQ